MEIKRFIHVNHINKVCIYIYPFFCKSIYELLPMYLQKPVVMNDRYTHNKPYCHNSSSIQAFHGIPESMSWRIQAPSATGRKPVIRARCRNSGKNQ